MDFTGRLKSSERFVTWAKVTAKELKNLRELLGMSQRDFAKILKVSHMTVQRGELRGPSRTLVLLIERALADGTLRLSKSKSEPE